MECLCVLYIEGCIETITLTLIHNLNHVIDMKYFCILWAFNSFSVGHKDSVESRNPRVEKRDSSEGEG